MNKATLALVLEVSLMAAVNALAALIGPWFLVGTILLSCVGLLWLHGGLARVFGKTEKQQQRVQNNCQAKLKLVFDPTNSRCVQPGALVLGPEWRYRIGVVNLSQASLRNCRLVLEDTEPIEPHVTYLDQPLGDKLPKDGAFDVHQRGDGKPSVYVDVLQEIQPEDSRALLRFTYAPADWQSDMFKRGGKYFENTADRLITLRLEGIDLQPVRIGLKAALSADQKRYAVSATTLSNSR